LCVALIVDALSALLGAADAPKQAMRWQRAGNARPCVLARM
jgi:hypothetical protein